MAGDGGGCAEVLDERKQWCDFVFSVFRYHLTVRPHQLDEPPPANFNLSFPSLLASFACLLSVTERQSAKKIRQVVFKNTNTSTVTILDLARNWEMELYTMQHEECFRSGHRMVLNAFHSNSFGLDTLRMMQKMALELHLYNQLQTPKPAFVAGQNDWIAKRLKLPENFPKPPTRLFNLNFQTLQDLKSLSPVNVSRIGLAFQRNVAAYTSKKLKFTATHQTKKQKLVKKVTGLKICLPTGERLKGTACDKHWTMVQIPLADGTRLELFLIVPDSPRFFRSTVDILPQMNYSNVKKWIDETKDNASVHDTNAVRPHVLIVPQFSLVPRQAVDLQKCFEAKGLTRLFDEHADLGELAPKGRLVSFLTADLLTIMKTEVLSSSDQLPGLKNTDEIENQGMFHNEKNSNTKTVLHAFYSVVWDSELALPCCVGRVGAPSDCDWAFAELTRFGSALSLKNLKIGSGSSSQSASAKSESLVKTTMKEDSDSSKSNDSLIGDKKEKRSCCMIM